MDRADIWGQGVKGGQVVAKIRRTRIFQLKVSSMAYEQRRAGQNVPSNPICKSCLRWERWVWWWRAGWRHATGRPGRQAGWRHPPLPHHLQRLNFQRRGQLSCLTIWECVVVWLQGHIMDRARHVGHGGCSLIFPLNRPHQHLYSAPPGQLPTYTHW